MKKLNVLGIVLKVGTIVLILGTAGYGYWWFSRPPVDTAVAVVAAPAPAVKKVKKVRTAVKSVETYVPEAKANLKLPPLVIADETKQVTGATTVKPSERSVTITSVIDTQTGGTTVYSKPEPLPWLAVESRGEARLDLGYKYQRGIPTPVQTVRLSVTHNFVQVKGFHLGVNAAIDTDGTLFAGLGVGYRW